jgi:hypothetical protein
MSTGQERLESVCSSKAPLDHTSGCMRRGPNTAIALQPSAALLFNREAAGFFLAGSQLLSSLNRNSRDKSGIFFHVSKWFPLGKWNHPLQSLYNKSRARMLAALSQVEKVINHKQLVLQIIQMPLGFLRHFP